MRRELHYFDIYPKVVQVGVESTINIKFKEKRYCPQGNKSIKIKIIPMTEDHGNQINNAFTQKVTTQDSILSFSYTFSKEQEYDIRVYLNADEYAQLSIYALEEDLYTLTPLKGDFHVHTNHSDGWESPEAVAAYYREAGFDFMVISDHRTYSSSVQAQQFYKDIKIDLNIVAGEEIHAPGNHVHIVNFGGEYSVNDIFKNDPETYTTEVKAIEDNLDPSLIFACDRERHVYASCLWVYGKIKEAKGLSIFAHPHWIANVHHVANSLTRLMFSTQCFDAFELIGGQTPKENNMQLAFYNTACKHGYGNFPIVGSSDSHGAIPEPLSRSKLKGGANPTHSVGEMYTIVFAAANTKDDIISAVKSSQTVAVEWYRGESPRVHGDYRLVSYALFLMSEYFPLHDEICREEGRLMRLLAYGGEEDAATGLERKSGRVERMMCKYIGRNRAD